MPLDPLWGIYMHGPCGHTEGSFHICWAVSYLFGPNVKQMLSSHPHPLLHSPERVINSQAKSYWENNLWCRPHARHEAAPERKIFNEMNVS